MRLTWNVTHGITIRRIGNLAQVDVLLGQCVLLFAPEERRTTKRAATLRNSY